MFTTVIVLSIFVFSLTTQNIIAHFRKVNTHQFIAIASLANVVLFLLGMQYIGTIWTLVLTVLISGSLCIYAALTKNVYVEPPVPPAQKTDAIGLLVTISVLNNINAPYKASTESVFFEDVDRGMEFAEAHKPYVISTNKVYIGK